MRRTGSDYAPVFRQRSQGRRMHTLGDERFMKFKTGGRGENRALSMSTKAMSSCPNLILAPSQSTSPHSRSVSLCKPHRRRAGRPHSRPALSRPPLPHRQNHMGRLAGRRPSVTRS